MPPCFWAKAGTAAKFSASIRLAAATARRPSVIVVSLPDFFSMAILVEGRLRGERAVAEPILATRNTPRYSFARGTSVSIIAVEDGKLRRVDELTPSSVPAP